jgi:hypothetical protein
MFSIRWYNFLANRLKVVLSKYISEKQSAFVEGRSIIDNALIAIELIHCLKRRTKGGKGELALKIDFSKAYDKVDGSYLKGVLEKIGFFRYLDKMDDVVCKLCKLLGFSER